VCFLFDCTDEHDLLSARDLSAAMAISDPSDSDSTLIVDQHVKKEKEQKSVIQTTTSNDGFKFNNNNINISSNINNFNNNHNANDMTKDSEDEAAATLEPALCLPEVHDNRGSSPISDDGSDVDSLHSFHYSPKAVDIPSAVRLAKRLYTLDGFKKSDVSRHLSKK
jgi:PH/SEC7 domain-containing protein